MADTTEKLERWQKFRTEQETAGAEKAEENRRKFKEDETLRRFKQRDDEATYRRYDFRRKIVYETTVRYNDNGTQTWEVSEIWFDLGRNGIKYSHEEMVDADGKHFVLEPEGKETIGAKLARDTEHFINKKSAMNASSKSVYQNLWKAAKKRNEKYDETEAGIEYEFAGTEGKEYVREIQTSAVKGGFKRVVTEYNLADGEKKAYKHVEWLNEDGKVIEQELPALGALSGEDIAHRTKNPTVDGAIDYDTQGNLSRVENMSEAENERMMKMWKKAEPQLKDAQAKEKERIWNENWRKKWDRSFFERMVDFLKNVPEKLGLRKEKPVEETPAVSYLSIKKKAAPIENKEKKSLKNQLKEVKKREKIEEWKQKERKKRIANVGRFDTEEKPEKMEVLEFKEAESLKRELQQPRQNLLRHSRQKTGKNER